MIRYNELGEMVEQHIRRGNYFVERLYKYRDHFLMNKEEISALSDDDISQMQNIRGYKRASLKDIKSIRDHACALKDIGLKGNNIDDALRLEPHDFFKYVELSST